MYRGLCRQRHSLRLVGVHVRGALWTLQRRLVTPSTIPSRLSSPQPRAFVPRHCPGLGGGRRRRRNNIACRDGRIFRPTSTRRQRQQQRGRHPLTLLPAVADLAIIGRSGHCPSGVLVAPLEKMMMMMMRVIILSENGM